SRAGLAPRFARWTGVIAGSTEPPVFDNDGADTAPHAVGACGNRASNADEVVVPVRPVHQPRPRFLLQALKTPQASPPRAYTVTIRTHVAETSVTPTFLDVRRTPCRSGPRSRPPCRKSGSSSACVACPPSRHSLLNNSTMPPL